MTWRSAFRIPVRPRTTGGSDRPPLSGQKSLWAPLKLFYHKNMESQGGAWQSRREESGTRKETDWSSSHTTKPKVSSMNYATPAGRHCPSGVNQSGTIAECVKPFPYEQHIPIALSWCEITPGLLCDLMTSSQFHLGCQWRWLVINKHTSQYCPSQPCL